MYVDWEGGIEKDQKKRGGVILNGLTKYNTFVIHVPTSYTLITFIRIIIPIHCKYMILIECNLYCLWSA